MLTEIKYLAQKHQALTEASIRWDVQNADKNGLATSGALIRKGRRIYIDEDLYLDWLRNPNKVAETAAA